MTTNPELTISYVPIRRAALFALLIAAFSGGMIAGAIAVRALEVPQVMPIRPTVVVPFKGVADNSMSDAARSAAYAPAWFRGVADRSMSDAARAAVQAAGSFRGVADNNMSDAARAAHLPGWFRGVAENDMTAAANEGRWRGGR